MMFAAVLEDISVYSRSEVGSRTEELRFGDVEVRSREEEL